MFIDSLPPGLYQVSPPRQVLDRMKLRSSSSSRIDVIVGSLSWGAPALVRAAVRTQVWGRAHTFSSAFLAAQATRLLVRGQLLRRVAGWCWLPLMCCSVLAPSAQAQWAFRVGGTNPEEGLSLAVTKTNDVIVAGQFSCRSATDPNDICDFDPSNTSEVLLFSGSGFVAQYSEIGELVWVRELSSWAQDVAVDSLGDVYVITSSCLVTKYSADGVAKWTLLLSQVSHCDEVAVSDEGDLYVAGDDVFLARLEADTGQLLWDLVAGGDARTTGLAVDADGNATVFGVFRSPFDADPGAREQVISSQGDLDLFVLSFDREGGLRWGFGLGGSATEDSGNLSIGEDAGVYITGRFGASVDFGSGPQEAGERVWASFIAKYDSSGVPIWSRTATSGTGRAVSVRDDRVIATGVFGTDINYSPDRRSLATLEAAGHADVYVAQFKTDGTYEGAFRMGGPADEWTNDMALDSRGSIYLTGKFWGVADFDPGPGVFELDARGPSGRGDLPDLFVAKYGVGGVFASGTAMLAVPEYGFLLSSPFPNPATAQASLTVVIDRPQRLILRVYDTLGRLVRVPVQRRYLELGRHDLQIQTVDLAAGVYLVTAHGEFGVRTQTIFVQ